MVGLELKTFSNMIRFSTTEANSYRLFFQQCGRESHDFQITLKSEFIRKIPN